ncbi:MAG: hypothetical protein QG594_849 [Bacteroidota bacterium]|jgi:hypothetical protein|nr:hypothetical protein [Bacteroidota bacterium]
MINKWCFYSSLTVIIAYLSSGFRPIKVESNEWFLRENHDGSEYLYPSKEQDDYINLNIPFTGNFFIGFKEAIGFKESQGKYKKINSKGYLGKYQFGVETLKTIGVKDSHSFLKSPKIQEKAFVAFLAKNKWELRDIIKKYKGKTFAGIKVTESGILAAAHLGGVGSVRRFFNSNGKRYSRDAYGTSIKSYMKKFGGYDTSFIVADRKADVCLN